MIAADLMLMSGGLGLIIGSFLNVVIYRVPQGKSVAFPSSYCPACEHKLRPWELIPVVSYLLLKGKCAKCRLKISWRYPALEILTGLLFILIFIFRQDHTLTALAFDLVFVSLLLALTFIDIDTLRLPDVLVGFVAAVGLVNMLVTGEPMLWQSLGGALGAGSIFLLIAYFYPQGMGLGDVKFVAALGLYLGLPGIFLVVFLASLMGVIVGGLRVLFLKKGLKDPIPFGPFLAAGSFLVLIGSEVFFQILGF